MQEPQREVSQEMWERWSRPYPSRGLEGLTLEPWRSTHRRQRRRARTVRKWLAVLSLMAVLGLLLGVGLALMTTGQSLAWFLAKASGQ